MKQPKRWIITTHTEWFPSNFILLSLLCTVHQQWFDSMKKYLPKIGWLIFSKWKWANYSWPWVLICVHTPSIAFQNLPPNSARNGYATEGTLSPCTCCQRPLRVGTNMTGCIIVCPSTDVNTRQVHCRVKRVQSWFRQFWFYLCWCKQRGQLYTKHLIQFVCYKLRPSEHKWKTVSWQVFWDLWCHQLWQRLKEGSH